MRQAAFALVAAALVGGFASFASAAVVPGDTFSVAVVGFNANTGDSAYLVNPVTATFGTSTAFTGAGFGGQTVTVNASETIGVTNTVDTIIVSVPSNFVPTGATFSGPGGATQVFTNLRLEIGGFTAGNNPVNFLVPVGTVTGTSRVDYSAGFGGSIAPTPVTVLGGGNTTLTATTAANVGASDNLNNQRIYSVRYVATYATVVPEPASLGLLGLAGFGLLRRRSR